MVKTSKEKEGVLLSTTIRVKRIQEVNIKQNDNILLKLKESVV